MKTRFTRTPALLLLALAAMLLSAAPSAQAATFVATVGPGHTISLRTQSGSLVRSVRAGTTHTIVVRDRARDHNFRLAGPGYARQTTVSGVSTQRWTVRFRRGTWTYLCGPHPVSMRGSLRAI